MNVEQIHLVDGPHTTERLTASAADLAHLGRYLAHATHTQPSDPTAVYELTRSLAVGLRSLSQAVRQLGARVDAIASDPALRVDDLGAPHLPVVVAACASLGCDDAAAALDSAARRLDVATQAASRLCLAESH